MGGVHRSRFGLMVAMGALLLVLSACGGKPEAPTAPAAPAPAPTAPVAAPTPAPSPSPVAYAQPSLGDPAAPIIIVEYSDFQ